MSNDSHEYLSTLRESFVIGGVRFRKFQSSGVGVKSEGNSVIVLELQEAAARVSLKERGGINRMLLGGC